MNNVLISHAPEPTKYQIEKKRFEANHLIYKMLLLFKFPSTKLIPHTHFYYIIYHFLCLMRQRPYVNNNE